MKARRLSGGKKGGVVYGTVSRKRSFKFLSDERIAELKRIKLKKRSEAKVKWAVNAFKEWCVARLENDFDQIIFDVDLDDVEKIDKIKLEYVLCRFVPEVTKSKGEGPYPGKTLYQ